MNDLNISRKENNVLIKHPVGWADDRKPNIHAPVLVGVRTLTPTYGFIPQQWGVLGETQETPSQL